MQLPVGVNGSQLFHLLDARCFSVVSGALFAVRIHIRLLGLNNYTAGGCGDCHTFIFIVVRYNLITQHK